MKAVFLTGFLMLLVIYSNGQLINNRSGYNLKGYTYKNTDRYKPNAAAALAVIPGAGHIYTNEPLRGLIYPAGMTLSAYLIVAGGMDNWASGWSSKPDNTGDIKVALGAISFFGIYALNFIDAVRIAKIKNMHNRNCAEVILIKPFVSNFADHRCCSSAGGLSIKFSF